ncbi:hypothetical protein [Mucilaginibacter sp. UR6-11]|uniref:hypothetical protein n=1 Tax=Mucilaginibacter sp. UR6-11 TaxID=1435644 RepID=UPI001E3D3DA0|nr:hypothetical protein [Mucilaginibacter sp. UR6-11]MCC8423781.1 hypothetical protein [Mucilaginibacter sp. UR6-11]
MKKIIPAFILLVCLGFTAKAQQSEMKQTIDLADSKNHLNKVVTLCDTVYGLKIVSDTLTLLNMGGNYPHQKFTIAVRGNKLQLDWVNLKRKHLCVTGVLELYKNTLQITASEPTQITVSK